MYACADWSLWDLMLKLLTDRSSALKTSLAHFSPFSAMICRLVGILFFGS